MTILIIIMIRCVKPVDDSHFYSLLLQLRCSSPPCVSCTVIRWVIFDNTSAVVDGQVVCV